MTEATAVETMEAEGKVTERPLAAVVTAPGMTPPPPLEPPPLLPPPVPPLFEEGVVEVVEVVEEVEVVEVVVGAVGMVMDKPKFEVQKGIVPEFKKLGQRPSQLPLSLLNCKPTLVPLTLSSPPLK